MITRRRGGRWRYANLERYLLIGLVCLLAAWVLHSLYEVPGEIRTYADERLNQAVRKAVKTEIQEAVRKAP